MKRLLMTTLVILFTLTLLTGCAAWFPEVAANKPLPKRKRIPATQQVRPNTLIGEDKFTIVKGGWFNNGKFENQMAEKKNWVIENDNTGGWAIGQFDQMLTITRPLELKMSQEIKNGSAVFYLLGFYINDGVDIQILKGAFTFSFLAADSSVVSVSDMGSLFVIFDGHGSKTFDSNITPVIFNRDFNEQPDYKKEPNTVYVRLPTHLKDYQLIDMTIDPTRLRLVGALATKSP